MKSWESGFLAISKIGFGPTLCVLASRKKSAASDAPFWVFALSSYTQETFSHVLKRQIFN